LLVIFRFKRDGGDSSTASKMDAPETAQAKKKEEIQVIESNRSRNVVFGKRKVHMPPDKLTKAINTVDVKSLNGEVVEILLRCFPTPEETEALKEHANESHKLAVTHTFSWLSW
jgi:hypothetical protein